MKCLRKFQRFLLQSLTQKRRGRNLFLFMIIGLSLLPLISYQACSPVTSNTTTGSGKNSAMSSSPTIVQQPASLTVNQGTTASFSVSSSGQSPLSFQWFKNGTLISGATSPSLNLSSVTQSDVATYYVTIQNVFGNISSNRVTLDVNSVPAIAQQPQGQTLYLGSSAGLSVAATGTAPLTYQWSKNGVAISGATNSTLNLTNAQSTDAGNYTVAVRNALGSVTSAAAVLTVTSSPVNASGPAITQQPQALTINQGASASLGVTATGTAPLSYQWQFNGVNISGATNAAYSITNAAAAQAGNYSVMIKNSAGSIISSAAKVSVNATTLACLSKEADIISALNSGADAMLCPSVTISVHQKLVMKADNQKIYTQGSPTDGTRATLIIDPTATSIDALIEAQPSSGSPAALKNLTISNLIIKGNAQVMGKLNSCPNNDCHGLVNLGNVVNPIVKNNSISDSRTWSMLVLTTNGGGCTGAQISNNQIGPSPAAPDNHFTDGISLNCGNSTVTGNTITDVTDGGIVVFAQQNVTVSNNTITANSARMNLAIGVTDYIQGCGNYSGTIFSNNTITSTGASGGFIYIGIAAGNHLWNSTTYDTPPSPCTQKYNQSAVIQNNTLTGPAIGVGIPVSGAYQFTITGNTLNSTNMLVDSSTVVGSNLQSGYSTVKAGALDSVITHAFWVYRLYGNFLSRPADSTGFAFWLSTTYPCSTANLSQATHDFILNAPEVITYLATRTATQTATAVYWAVLDRAPDTSGLTYWTGVVSSSASNAVGAASLAKSFYESSEYATLTSNGAACPYYLGN